MDEASAEDEEDEDMVEDETLLPLLLLLCSFTPDEVYMYTIEQQIMR